MDRLPCKQQEFTRARYALMGGLAEVISEDVELTNLVVLRSRHPDGPKASARFLPGSPARAVFACWGGHQRASTGVPKRAGVARLGWE
jgi:hypothetical protein